MSQLQSHCACGGLIVAGAAWAIADAIVRHNATERHRRWRRRRDVVEAAAFRRERLRAELQDRRLARAVLRENGIRP